MDRGTTSLVIALDAIKGTGGGEQRARGEFGSTGDICDGSETSAGNVVAPMKAGSAGRLQGIQVPWNASWRVRSARCHEDRKSRKFKPAFLEVHF